MKVRLWTQTLWSGHQLTAPVADLELATLGSEGPARASLQSFLSKHLERASAPRLAGFSLPEPIEVRQIAVVVPRLDLPRRIRIQTALDVFALVIPAVDDAWVIIPVLDHTFYVPAGEDLDEAIRSEVVRMAAVLKPEPADYLDLLPPQSSELETLELSVLRGSGGAGGAKARKKMVQRRRDARAEEVLASVARPLHRAPWFRAGPELVGLDDEQARLRTLLAADARVPVMLVGDPRVGKTELLWSVVREAHDKKGARPVWATSGAQLIAGMSGMGQWQERVRRVMEAAETLDAVIYFDDLSDLFGERSHGIDLPSALRPFVEDARVRVVGEITPAALDRLENRSVAFFSAFHRIRVAGQDREAGKEALRRRAAFDAVHLPDAPQLADEAIDPLVELTHRYFPYRPFPAKAMRLYESVRAIAVRHRGPDGMVPPIDPPRVLEAFSLESGIPEFLLRDDRALLADDVQRSFEERLIGQQAAVRAVVETICVVKAALQPTGKPLATFLFVGPTGVGKTELARRLARFLFGSEDRLVRFDMSEFADPLAAERLIRGTERQEGLLTRRVRSQPFSVLLLDEIEKADPAVFDLLLQVTGEGRLTDTRGKTTYFHNTIIVMTSNLGAAHRSGAVGFEAQSQADQAYYVRQVEKSFRPELVNRLDRIISFAPLSREQIQAVTQLAVAKVERRRGVLDRGLSVDFTPAALAHLADGGYSAAYGARAIRRHVDDTIAAPLAQLLARVGRPAHGAALVVRLATDSDKLAGRVLGRHVHDGLELILLQGRRGRARRDTQHVEEMSALRREVDAHLALDRVEQIRAQRQVIRSQLNVGGEGRARKGRKARARDERRARDIAELSQEHHRLQEVLQEAELARDALVAAEEIGLAGLLAGEDTSEVLAEAQVAHRSFCKNLAYLLLAGESRRDEGTFAIQEVGPHGGFRLWLVPLIAAAAKRNWSLSLHVPGERAPASSDWPALCPWGPRRSGAEIQERIEAGERFEDGNLLLRVRGPYAGVLLALEQGVHRFERRGEKGRSPDLFVRLLALRSVYDPDELSRGKMAPLGAATRHNHAKSKPIRLHLAAHPRLELLRAGVTLSLPLEEYWDRFEEVATAELLRYERDEESDREAVFAGTAEGGREDPS